MTLPCHSNNKAAILQVVYTGQEKKTIGKRRTTTTKTPLEPWTSEWCGTDGYDDEFHLEETDWTEDSFETDDYEPDDSTFSHHYPALLDRTVETQERRCEQT